MRTQQIQRPFLHVLLTFAVIAFLSSCRGFLDEVSQDQVVPKRVSDLSELLYGEAYARDRSDMSVHRYLDLMSDDVRSFIKSSGRGVDTRSTGFGYYTWQADPEQTLEGKLSEDRAWYVYYRMILFANVVLKELPSVQGAMEEKNFLEGECHAIRAWAYFMLANLYADPYSASTARESKGVPIHNISTMEDVQLPRASLEETYGEMTQAIEKAVEAFGRSKKEKTPFRWNKEAAHLLASRIYLYMGAYDKAIEHATMVLRVNPTLLDLNLKLKDDPTNTVPFINKGNTEILFSYGSYYINYFIPGVKGGFPASNELLETFESSDLRYQRTNGVYIRRAGSFFSGYQIVPVKNGETSESQIYGFALRTAEAYLNRAEAYAERGRVQEALQDLNRLRKARIKEEAYTPLEANEKNEVIDLIRAERRRELCFEQHRWFDLRRWGRPQIEHVYAAEASPAVDLKFVLLPQDPAYTLPIPNRVIQADPSIIQNDPRPSRQPQNQPETT